MGNATDTKPNVASGGQQKRARWGRRFYLTLLAVFVLLGLFNFWGSSTSTVSASTPAYKVSVTYPSRTRPSLPIEWKACLHHRGPFERPVRIAINLGYFDYLDFNNVYPTPITTKNIGNQVIWTFAPPAGNTLNVLIDGRTQPGRRGWAHGVATVLSQAGNDLISVRYTTVVVP